MDQKRFYLIVLSDYETMCWISAYVSIFREPCYLLLEEVRKGLLNDSSEETTTSLVIDNIRLIING